MGRISEGSTNNAERVHRGSGITFKVLEEIPKGFLGSVPKLNAGKFSEGIHKIIS